MATTRVLPAASRRPGRAETAAALSLAARMPRLLLESRRVAASLAHGIHGRRRAGSGESFWQFRPYVAGEAASRVDWRRSGRDDRLYVREREWETPHAVWIWVDRSASMAFSSDLATAPKVERGIVLGLALADALVGAGERVGLLGLRPPAATRRIAELVAECYAADRAGEDDDLPPALAVHRMDEVLLVGDFLSPLPEIVSRVEAISSRGARGHLLLVVDPVEETFPFDGQAMLEEGEAGLRLRIGDARAWRGAYRIRMDAHRRGLDELVRRRGWTVTVHHTDRPASEAALRIQTLLAASRPGGGTGG